MWLKVSGKLAVLAGTLALATSCGGSDSSGSPSVPPSASTATATSTPDTDQGRLLYCDGAGIVHATLVAGSNGTATTEDSANGFGQAADKFNNAAIVTTGPNKAIYQSLGTDTGRMRVDLLNVDVATFASDSAALQADIKRAPDTSSC